MVEHMFEELPPSPTALAAASDAVLAEAISGWSAVSAAAEARKLAAIAELQRRAQAGELRARDAIDDTDAAAAVVSCALTVTHGKAIGLLDLAVTLRDRLPKVGARFLDGQITGAMIATIAWRTFLVTEPALPAIDTEIAERAPAWGKLSQHGLEKAIDVWIDQHDPDAVRRTRTAMRGRYFAIGDREDAAGGTVSVHGRLSVVDAALMHQRLVAMIGGPCRRDPRTMDQRRADAVGAAFGKGSFFLACQCPDPECKAKVDDGRASSIVIHVIAEQDSLFADPEPECHGEDPARAPKPRPRTKPMPQAAPTPAPRADVGPAAAEPEPVDEPEPVAEPQPTPPRRFKAALIPSFKGAIVPAPLLAELIIRGTRIRVIDPTNLTTEPQYRASAALQRFVHARDLTCRFPGCNKPAVHTDIDHTVPWPTGSTHPANTKSYCRLHHLIKTFVPGWKDRQQPDGTVTVTTPAGLTYSTKPLSALLFPDWNIATPPAPPPEPRQTPSPTRQGRHPRVPTRQQTPSREPRRLHRQRAAAQPHRACRRGAIGSPVGQFVDRRRSQRGLHRSSARRRRPTTLLGGTVKILVATGHTQGTSPGDYHYCIERELVWIQEPCDRDLRDPDRPCGCGRGFAGAASHRATTTAMVVESEMSREDVVLAFETSLGDGGWPVAWAEDVADDNLEIAAQLPVGSIITRNLENFHLRGVFF